VRIENCPFCDSEGVQIEPYGMVICSDENCAMRESGAEFPPDIWNDRPQLAHFREKLLDKETQGRIMHETWTRAKREQGFHHPDEEGYGITSHPCPKCHADLIPWEKLPEKQKDINRHAFDALIKYLTE